MVKLLALFVLLAALGGGGAAGFMLRPPAPEAEVEEAPPERPLAVVTLENSFAVPILRGGRSWGHVVLTLGVEAGEVTSDVIYSREPILRDHMTEALFLHGSLGDFDGDFTEPMAMNRLRARLNDAARAALADPTARALIISLVRQQR
ncbi:MAG: hypothetical protein AAGF30_07430 [Pseudomonadota bacterium]